jgi:hypothetical protein
MAGRRLGRVERYAVVIGNNRGQADETALRHANPMPPVFDVLRDLGGFEPVNMVLFARRRGSACRPHRRASRVKVNRLARCCLLLATHAVALDSARTLVQDRSCT